MRYKGRAAVYPPDLSAIMAKAIVSSSMEVPLTVTEGGMYLQRRHATATAAAAAAAAGRTAVQQSSHSYTPRKRMHGPWYVYRVVTRASKHIHVRT